MVDVDPVTGALHLEVVDLAIEGQGPPLELRRVHTGGEWRISFDERIDITEDGLLHHDLDGTRLLEVRLPLPEGVAGDGSWQIGTRFGEEATRIDEGYALRTDGRLALFDTEGRLVRVEDEDGDGIDYLYDELGVARIKADDGRSLRVLHDLAGNVSAVAAPGGEEHFYQWEGGRLVASIGEQGRIRMVHEGPDLAAIIWPDGSQLRVRYEDDRVVDIGGPGPLRRQLRWSDDSVEIFDQRGVAWRIERTPVAIIVTDELGRQALTLVEDGEMVGWRAPDGVEVRLDRDPEGRIVGVSGWRLGWDGEDLVRITDPLGAPWTAERDDLGRLIGVIGPAGQVRRYQRDSHGQIVEVTNEGAPWRVVRDARGLVAEFVAPTGATTHLTRDSRGRVTSVVDPSGAETLLSGFAGDQPGTLLGRAGAIWVIGYDTLGRAIRVETPTGETLTLRRNRVGDLAGIDRGSDRLLRLRYRTDGVLTQVQDALGQAWGVVVDPAGRVRALHRPDGTEVDSKWAPTGRLVALGDLTITRSKRGDPTTDGTTRWTWDVLGRWTGASAPGLELSLIRDAAGKVTTVRAGSMTFTIGRDLQGRVTSVKSGEAEVKLRRDARGAVVALDESIFERDDRGLVFRVHTGDRIRRGRYDADGLPVRWASEEGVALSIERDVAGRIVRVRYPDGTLLRRAYTPDKEGVRIEGSDGAVLLDRLNTLDAAGRVERVTELSPEALDHIYHRDPGGTLIAREQAGGAWLWSPGQVSAPDGGRVIYDDQGKPTHATPPVGPRAWGTGEDVLAYLVDEAGCIRQVIGEDGTVDVDYDDLGRPVALRGPAEQLTELEWDPLGRLVAAGESRIVWGLERPLAIHTPDGVVEVLSSEHAGWVLIGDHVASVVPDVGASPRALVRDSVVESWLEWSPMGFATHDAAVPIGPGQSWLLGPGWPLIDGGGLIDPVSGTRSCQPVQHGRSEPQGFPSIEGAGQPWWDPGPWSSDDVWADPLELLVAMGELDPGIDDGWVAVGQAAPPLPWLPQAAATPAPPLFPGPDELPLGALPPLTSLVLESSLPPSGPISESAALERILEPDWAGRKELAFFAEALPSWALQR